MPRPCLRGPGARLRMLSFGQLDVSLESPKSQLDARQLNRNDDLSLI